MWRLYHIGHLKNGQHVVVCDKCSHLLDERVVRYHWQELEYEEVLPDDTLWRYMGLSKFISIISRNELYFTSANTFEDIFECAKRIVDRKVSGMTFIESFSKIPIR